MDRMVTVDRVAAAHVLRALQRGLQHAQGLAVHAVAAEEARDGRGHPADPPGLGPAGTSACVKTGSGRKKKTSANIGGASHRFF